MDYHIHCGIYVLLILCHTNVYCIRSNIMELQATFSDGLLDFYLTEDMQCVVLNGKKSSWQDVKSGIPQGSILGPLLFLIYVNDLPRSISSQVFLFADDTKLIRSIFT